jgi:hypothetical protein
MAMMGIAGIETEEIPAEFQQDEDEGTEDGKGRSSS